MYIGIDVHKQDAQVAVRNEAGDVVIEATSNYYHIYNTLSEYLRQQNPWVACRCWHLEEGEAAERRGSRVAGVAVLHARSRGGV